MESGQYIKVVFKNSTQVEGIVESWSDSKAVLISPDGTSKFIIFNISADVLGVKIYLESPIKKTHQKFDEVVQQFKSVQSEPSADDMRVHSLAQLKTLMNEQEKKIITEKVREHSISNVRLPQYGLPNISQKPRAK